MNFRGSLNSSGIEWKFYLCVFLEEEAIDLNRFSKESLQNFRIFGLSRGQQSKYSGCLSMNSVSTAIGRFPGLLLSAKIHEIHLKAKPYFFQGSPSQSMQ